MRIDRKFVLNSILHEIFDVFVIGGGVTGSGIVRDAAMRGLKSILVEKGDFASGTSSKSGKLVHGGLRYLAYGHVKLVFDACWERFYLMTQVAPHIVKPIPFLMPVFSDSKNPRWLVAIGLIGYELLAMFRNFKIFRYISPLKISDTEPLIRKENLKGGFLFYDCAALDFRLVIDTLKSAYDHGSRLLNYCTVVSIDHDERENLNIVKVRDGFTGDIYQCKSKVVVNASGAWADDVLKISKDQFRFDLKITTGIHLMFDRKKFKIDHAIVFESPTDKRNLYIFPWQNRVLFGTTDKYFHGDKNNIGISEAEIQYLLKAIKDLMPGLDIQTQDIKMAYSGIRPLIGSNKDIDESKLSRDFTIRISDDGFVSITGGKLTTYRYMAKNLIDKVVKKFFDDRNVANKCPTLSPISGGDAVCLTEEEIEDIAEEVKIDPSVVRHLISYYGSNYKKILEYIKADFKKGERIIPESRHVWAEIDYSIDYEFVERLTDIIQRRTSMFYFAPQESLCACDKIAKYAGEKLGWHSERIESEVSLYRKEVDNVMKVLQCGND